MHAAIALDLDMHGLQVIYIKHLNNDIGYYYTEIQTKRNVSEF